MKTIFPSFIILLIFSGCMNSLEADLIVHNARIYSVDPGNTIYEAMAIKDGRIIELGPERQILNKYRAKEKVDAQMRSVFPGFIDAHCHFLAYGLSLEEANLIGTSSFEEVLERTRNHAKAHPSQWIRGRGWDQNDWEINEYPHKAALDSLFPNTPVILKRVDGHAAIINQSAIEFANLTTGMVIEGGELLEDENGLTGVLIDNAVDLVTDLIPDRPEEELRRALLAAEEDCFGVGLTTVDDAGMMKREVDVINDMHESGTLRMRIYAMLSDDQINFDHYLSSGPVKTERLNVRSFKFYADGALGSRGACLLSPYDDIIHERHVGFLLSEPEHFRTSARLVYAAGFQMNSHCIGDSANRTMLDIYGEVLGGSNDHRWRIEHAQVVHRQDIEKFAEFSIIPSIQPTHATSDMYWAEQRLGRNRVRRAYAYQELKEQLGMVALGTDFPVEGINPINTFYAAVVRKDHKDYPEGGYQMENALSREEALKGMTLWAAMSNFEENEKGTLEAGKFADFVILDRDIMSVSDDQILGTQVLKTVLNGEIVYDALAR